MQRKTRRIVFIIAAIVFIIAALSLVLYSFGYRWDKEKFQPVLTGGLYFRVNTVKPQIYLNGKFLPKATPGLLSSGIFLPNLLPDIYQVEIKKDNYFEWEKKVEVESQKVTSFSFIVLLPKNPMVNNIYQVTEAEATTTKLKTSEEIIDFLPLANNKEIIIQTKEKATSTDAVLKISNFINGSNVEIYRQKLAKNESLNLIPHLKISDGDANEIIFDLTKGSTTTFYLWQRIQPEKLQNLSQLITTTFKLKNPIQKIEFYPNINGKYLILSGKDLMAVDFNKNETKKITTGIRDFQMKDYSIFWIDDNNAVFSYNLILDSSNPLSILDLPPKFNINQMTIAPNVQCFALLLDDGTLYLFRLGQPFEKINDVVKFVFAPDSKKIAYLTKEGEVRVRYLTDVTGDVINKKGDEVLIRKGISLDADVEWYADTQHLILADGKVIYFAEIDNRDQINTYIEEFDFNHYLLTNNKNGTIWGIRPDLIQKIDLGYEKI
ncbi:MAG TPA: hypothetical protein PLX48_02680 [Candidatus Paceibacterota bacterium]|nr:hypothetical protein [Candidatus Paceibacterota bacterium]